MAEASGEVVETPTAELPYKAVISHDGEVIGEQYFSSRVDAEVFIVETLEGLKRAASDEGFIKPS